MTAEQNLGANEGMKLGDCEAPEKSNNDVDKLEREGGELGSGYDDKRQRFGWSKPEESGCPQPLSQKVKVYTLSKGLFGVLMFT